MEDIRTIRRRMRTIKNTQQITRAMETVAAAKLWTVRLPYARVAPMGRKK